MVVPVWGRVCWTLARLRWAGLADVPFALVTCAELMFWTKPHAGYYRQILAGAP